MIATPAPPPARIQVVEKEFSLALSRKVVRAGTAIIELANFGEDPHDLRLQRVGGSKIYGWRIAQPGATQDRELKLVPGRYQLWCSLADHRARGMVATLVVVAAPTH
jgi:hypothetical protein